MYLKALEMRGFKSFPDKTRLDFERGVTAVVGPNGSGKSNISDAIRWVLGEMSPKSLRGAKMEDVIFAGTAKRSQTGFCEVSLVVNNDDDELNCGTDDVKITRKYFRNGDSEYKINEKVCRLKDIYELFLNTGIGREGYSVIGQGKIAEVLSQKSEERRHIFEEAAGISKYRYRKNEAQKKLNETDANLLRLTDIISEISARLSPLEKEAENAKKYLILAARKKELEISIWLDKITKARTESQKIKIKYEDSKSSYDAKEIELNRSEENLNQLTEKKQVLMLDLESERQILSQLDEERSNLSGKRAVSENSILHYDERKSTIKSEIDTLKNVEMANLENQFLWQKQRSNEAEILCEKAKKELQNVEIEVKVCQDALEKNRLQLEEKKFELREIKEQIINFKISENANQNAQTSDNARREFLNSEIEKINRELEETQEFLNASIKRRVDFKNEKEEIFQNISEEKKNFLKLNELSEILLSEKNSLQASFSASYQRRETLDRMDKLLEGYPGSVKAVMGENSLKGICGPVSRILTVSGEYVTAIETALGASVTNIVVENEENAKSAIKFLKDKGAGRATFLPLTSIKGNTLFEKNLDTEKGYVGIASTLINFNSKYKNIADYLLGRCVVADNIDNASIIARKYSYRFKIVTLDGQVINSGGSYTGGSAANRAGVMSRNADIEVLDIELKKLGGEITKNAEKIKETLEVRKQTQNYIEALQNDLSNSDSGLYKSEAEIKIHNEHISACTIRIEKTNKQLFEFDPHGLFENAEKLKIQRKSAENKDQELTEICRNLSEKFNLAEEEFQKSKDKESKSKLYNLTAEKDFEASGLAVKTAFLRFEETKIKLESLQEEEKLLENKVSDIKAEEERALNLLAKAEEDTKVKKEQIEKSVKEITEFEYKITTLLTTQKELVRDKENFFKDYTKYSSMLEQYEKDYDTLTSKLWEEYEITFSDALQLNYSEPTSGDVTELNSVRAKIRSLGTVNVNAVEEYKETKERYDFMTKQVEDLQNSQKSLESVIKRLESDMKAIFAAAIVDINKNFGEVFVELFGGGKGEIVITEPENILESGIEINVQPPGKMVKSISLLSGGEQAFTAIALYFAILRVHTAPFYVFDEIEAALDDVNVNRFGAYLKKHSTDTQFIVITHRRGTMEVAETLYGVTMQEKGVSSFLKLKLEEVEKKTGIKL